MTSNTKPFKDPKKELILRSLLQKTSQALLMLDVSDIYLLKTITETGSINKAAEILYMSQPTLSKRISRLEQVLKVELFHRQSTGMKPTTVTEYLIDNGKQIQTKLDAMCRHVELLSNLEGGTLHVGVSPVIEQLFFPKVLMDFVEDTKDVEISFKVDVPEKLKQGVLDGELDIAIGPFAEDELPQDLAFQQIKNEAVVYIVRPDHPITKKSSKISYKTLMEYPGIGPTMNPSMKKFLEDRGALSLLKITCDNYRICKSIVKMSDYFSGGPPQLFKKDIEEGELIELAMEEPVVWSAYSLIRPESIHTPTVKKFLEILNEYVDY